MVKIASISLLVIMFLLVFSPAQAAGTYYVGKTGCSDSGSGSQSQPFCTVSKGVSVLQPGDTLRIGAGTYVERVTISRSGTASARITIIGEPGSVIDGQDRLPSDCYSYLVTVYGSYVTLRDLRVHNSFGAGVAMSGNYSHAEGVTVQRTGESGLVLIGTGNIADGVTVTGNGNRYGQCASWGAALTTVGTNSIIQNSTSHDNRGEGISAYSSASGAILRNNISYNNASVGIYLDSANNVQVLNNLVYYTGPNGSSGIAIGGETGVPHTLTIVGNVVTGSWLNFQVDSNVRSLTNVKVTNNTFVNSYRTASDISSGYNMSLYIRPSVTSFSGSTFADNLVVEEDTRLTMIALPANHPGLTFSHNFWTRQPVSQAQSSTDKTGAVQFVNRSAYDFRLPAGSIAAGFGAYPVPVGAVVTPSPTATRTPTATMTPVVLPTATKTVTPRPTFTATPTQECIDVKFSDGVSVRVCH